MQAEIATEAVRSITSVSNCPKNDVNDHVTNFIGFDKFSIDDLPAAIRTKEVYDYLKYLGQTVVRLVVGLADGGYYYGSGVVYKIDDKYAVLTNNHVVSNEEQVKNTSVDFFYDDEESIGVETCHGDVMKGESTAQDRCFFKFSPIPQRLQDMNLFDNRTLMAILEVTYTDGSEQVIMGFPHVNRDGHFLLLYRNEVQEERLQDIVSCNIHIKDNFGQNHPIEFLEFGPVEDKVIFARVKSLPDIVVNSLTKLDQLISATRDSIHVITISHPHGGPKMLTFGKIVDITEEEHMKKLLHSAPTCPGSSGGLVVTICSNESVASDRGFASNVCCHCEGERMESYRGIVLETGNLNTSLFNR